MSKNDSRIIYLSIVMFAVIVFCSIYGIYVLNPTYTDWLMTGGDLTQHYLGWKAYRESDWMFPLGMLNTLAYPEKTSIIFTDSIPLFAIFFKLLSPILPAQFQYFGFWGLLCFILQGIFTARIFRYFTKSKVNIILISILLLYTPVMVHRMFGHTALAGQWIILYSIEPLFLYEKYLNTPGKQLWIHVIIMGLLSPLIHIYFLLMNGIILIGICLLDILYSKKIKRAIYLISSYLLAAIFVVALLGGFSSGMQAENSGLGKFSMNLNALFNPQGWSRVLPDLLLYGDGQYEGLAYLGLGCLILALCTCCVIVYKLIKKMHICNRRKGVILGIVTIISLFFALSPIITFNDKILYSFEYPEIIIKLWSVFRATGRIGWIVIYVIILCCAVSICSLNKRLGMGILIVCLLIQVYDICPQLNKRYAVFAQKAGYQTLLSNENFWNDIASNKTIKHIVFTEIEIESDYMFAFTNWATDNEKTVNLFYFARDISGEIEKNLDDSLQNLSCDNIYIFFESNKMECMEYPLHYYAIDGVIVGYTEAINGYPEINIYEFN